MDQSHKNHAHNHSHSGDHSCCSVHDKKETAQNLVKGDLTGIVRAHNLSQATMRAENRQQ